MIHNLLERDWRFKANSDLYSYWMPTRVSFPVFCASQRISFILNLCTKLRLTISFLSFNASRILLAAQEESQSSDTTLLKLDDKCLYIVQHHRDETLIQRLDSSRSPSTNPNFYFTDSKIDPIALEYFNNINVMVLDLIKLIHGDAATWLRKNPFQY